MPQKCYVANVFYLEHSNLGARLISHEYYEIMQSGPLRNNYDDPGCDDAERSLRYNRPTEGFRGDLTKVSS